MRGDLGFEVSIEATQCRAAADDADPENAVRLDLAADGRLDAVRDPARGGDCRQAARRMPLADATDVQTAVMAQSQYLSLFVHLDPPSAHVGHLLGSITGKMPH